MSELKQAARQALAEEIKESIQELSDGYRFPDLLEAVDKLAALSHPEPQPEAVQVPQGWRMVPEEPTQAMKKAAKKADMDHGPFREWIEGDWDDRKRTWDAMLAAAPQPPVQAKSEVEDLIAECIPGGSVCDPQEVADNIRRYCNAWPDQDQAEARGDEPTDFQLEQLFDAVHEHGEYGRGFREHARSILGHPAPAAPQAGEAERHTDDIAVDQFAAAMKVKLAKARAKGRTGWNYKAAVSDERLAMMLVEHVAKGDPVDVANFAMFLHQRGADHAVLAEIAANHWRPASQPMIREGMSPLTREKIDAIMTEHYPLDSLLRESVDAFEACVRDIERAHGIQEKQ